MVYIYEPSYVLKKDTVKLKSNVRIIAEPLKRAHDTILDEYNFNKKRSV